MKYKKGDKFEIEIAEVHTHYTDDGKPYSLYRIKGFNSLVFDEYGLDRLQENIKSFFNDDELRTLRIKNYVKFAKNLFDIKVDIFDRAIFQAIDLILQREKESEKQ